MAGRMLSGGEPLAWPQLWELNERLGEFALRIVLLTNATLLTRELAERLAVQEVQVSLDGLERGHDSLRGAGIGGSRS
jgi:MoaA/NifB/PqqE/SkfB family radical SAM enzyme